jgi:transcriptional regulator with XRE-family HTH domain
MTQAQVAEAMGTTQTVIARLESGRVTPSTRTLERFAKATRTGLRISFEPETSENGTGTSYLEDCHLSDVEDREGSQWPELS